MKNPKGTAIALIIVGVLLVVLGVALLFATWGPRRWPTTTGTITRKVVVEHEAPVSVRARYKLDVLYKYEVAGTTYEGTRIAPADTLVPIDEANQLLAEMPESVEVRYDPNDPKTSFLRPDPLWVPILPAAIGIVLIAIGTGILILKTRPLPVG